MSVCKNCAGFGCIECEEIEPMAYYDENGCIPKNKVTIIASIEVPVNIIPALEILIKEYKSACKKHPVFPDCKFKQFAILSEEVHEYNKELQHDAFEMEVGSNTITELAQIGAVVLRMLEGYKNG